MARRIMTEFQLDEISAVDRPAQEHAKMTIMKRDEPDIEPDNGPNDPPAPPIEEPPVDKRMATVSTAGGSGGGYSIGDSAGGGGSGGGCYNTSVNIEKRPFSEAQRESAASSGAAESDGSYPIENTGDLKNAIRAYGRSKDKAKTKSHIISRARALGATAMLPAGWTGKRYDKEAFHAALDIFDDELESDFTRDELIIIGKALTAGDAVEPATDGQHLETAAMAESEVKLEKDAPAVEAVSVKEMETIISLRKSIDSLQRENAILKMSPEHRQYMEDVHMNEDATSFFLKADASARDAIMKTNPVEKKLPANIQKLLDQGAENEKILKVLQEKDEVLTFSKKAEELGSPPAFGEVLRKAYIGDAKAIEELEQHIKSLNAQICAGKIFDEFGTSRGAIADPYAMLKAKAADLRKIAPNLTEAQAFASVFEDPANRDIRDEYKKQNRPGFRS